MTVAYFKELTLKLGLRGDTSQRGRFVLRHLFVSFVKDILGFSLLFLGAYCVIRIKVSFHICEGVSGEGDK